MSVIYLQNNCLRLISTENNTEEVVFKAPSLLQDYSFQENITNKDNWTLYCLEDTGNIYCVKSQQVNDQLRSPKHNSENQEIFSDLLEPIGDDIFEVECTESSVRVFKLQTCHAVYKVNGKPLGICFYKDLLISLANYHQMYAFTVISLTGTWPGLIEDKPTVFFNKIREDQIYGRPTSCLMKIVTADLIEGEYANTTTNTLKIENALFKSLFGSTTALLNSPVLLFCPPEGSVYNIPVHYLLKQLFETNIKDTQIFLKVFCETSSAVINLLTLTVPYRTYIDSQDIEKEVDVHVFLICSHNGSVITYHFDSLHLKHELMSQLDITGPVLGTDTYCNRLYHSTMTHVYKISLEIMNWDKGRYETIQVKDVKSRKQGMVFHIKVVASSSFTDTRDAPCILHCVQKDGTHRLLDSILFDKIPDIPIRKLLVKDILISIDQTDKDQQRLSEEMKICDEWLEQMSIAAFLLNRQFTIIYSTDCSLTGPGIGKQPIHCKFKVIGNFQMPEGQRHINLYCEITNQMPRHLSSDWSLEISILPIKYTASSESNNQTTLLTLDNGLKTMEIVKVTIAIHPDLILSGFDLLVTLTLDTRYCSATSNDKGTNLIIAVIQERLDILHFLVPRQEFFSAARHIDKTKEISCRIKVLAHQQPTASCFIPYIDKFESKSTKVSIIKSLQLTKEMYDKLTNENGQDPVLKFLLKDSRLSPDDSTKNKCHVMSLIGNHLYLEVKDIQNKTRTKKLSNHPGEVTHAVLIIHGDMRTVAAVSMSIERKLKVYGLHHSGFPDTVGPLKQFHHKIQSIEMDIQLLISKKTTDREPEKEIRNIYHRVRSLQDID